MKLRLFRCLTVSRSWRPKAPEQAPTELEAAALVVEAAAPEGGTAQVVEQVGMVATADRECCMCVHRIMLFTCWWCSCRPRAICAMDSCSW